MREMSEAMLALLLLAASAAGSPQSVRGDFDRDGKIDVAEIAPGKGQDASPLVIRSGNRAHSFYLVDTFRRADLADIYLTKMERGRWATWCGKGGGAQQARCKRRTITVRGDVLTYGTREASQAAALWTGRRFEVVWLSD
jgi:hypothetical protein